MGLTQEYLFFFVPGNFPEGLLTRLVLLYKKQRAATRKTFLCTKEPAKWVNVNV